jgi:hypothetical protein
VRDDRDLPELLQQRSVGLPCSIAALCLISACAGPSTTPAVASGPVPFPADTVSQRALASGARYLELHLPQGPWVIHLVEVDPRACGVGFRTVKGGGERVGRETTSAMAARAADPSGQRILAAINGDFFSFDPPGVPEGPQIQAGRVLKSEGGYREALESRQLQVQPAFGVTQDGRPFIRQVSTRGSLEASGGFTAPIHRINAPARSAFIQLYTPFFGDATPPDSGAVEIVVRGISDVGGTTALGVVLGVDTLVDGVSLPAGTAVFAGRDQGALFLRTFARPGDTIRWQVHTAGAPGDVAELIGGFPLLLQNGQRVEHQTGAVRPPFSERRHPRSAIARNADGAVFLLAVDGRQPGYSEGMSLDELTAFLVELGITDALNLDGGGSTTLVVEGVIANRPSDQEGERPVANALLVLGPGPAECRTP